MFNPFTEFPKAISLSFSDCMRFVSAFALYFRVSLSVKSYNFVYSSHKCLESSSTKQDICLQFEFKNDVSSWFLIRGVPLRQFHPWKWFLQLLQTKLAHGRCLPRLSYCWLFASSMIETLLQYQSIFLHWLVIHSPPSALEVQVEIVQQIRDLLSCLLLSSQRP